MTGARDSTHVDTVGEKCGRVVLNLGPPSRTQLVIHDGPGRRRPVKIITITAAVSIRPARRMMHRIEAELLIPGHGGPIRDGVVVLDGSRIGYAGPAGTAPPTPGAPATRVATVMPGMWECHGHFLGTRTFDLAQLPLEPEALRAARCTRDLRAALDAGSTSGGHADLHSFPLDWMRDFSGREGLMRLADGPDECARAAREQLRRNAQVIKVCASGGVLSEVDDPIHQQFTTAELRAIVEVAGLADRVVAAHCHGKPGIMAALRAGVRTIEHGTYLDDEGCDAMRESGAILVPTRTIVEDILANPGNVPDYAQVKLEAIADIHAQAVTRAYEHGVTIAMGTDIALTGADLPNSWGQNGSEPGYLVKLGMSPLEAIEAATATGPLTVGPQAALSGRLAEGYDADVITLDGDPVADIGVLGDPARVTAVWTRGRPVKGAAA